jgi:ribose transport system substrate-binding protein
MKSLANEFFKVMGEGTEKWQKEDNTFDLTMVGMNSETDIDTQIAAMENFITQKVDLIALAPADSVGLVPSVKKALDAGITVVNFDVKLDDKALAEAGLQDFLFVGPDNAEGARLAGEALAQKLGPGGKVIIIEGNPGADNATQRKNGFMKAVEDGQLELLDSVTAHWETEEANTVMTNLLTKHPDVQGVMAANDSMALGVIKALDAAGKAGQIQVVGFDNIPAVQPLLQNGTMLATIDQFGPDMAKNAIQTGFKVLNGKAERVDQDTRQARHFSRRPVASFAGLSGRRAPCVHSTLADPLGSIFMTGVQNILEMRGITKRFPGVTALDHVDLNIRQGEVHVLVGENGAGKSSLVKVLCGIYQPEEGEIRYAGAPYAPQTAVDALRAFGSSIKSSTCFPFFPSRRTSILSACPPRAGWLTSARSTRKRKQSWMRLVWMSRRERPWKVSAWLRCSSLRLERLSPRKAKS